MQLVDLVNEISVFNTWSHAEKIKFFVWYLHVYQGKERVIPSDIRACYDGINIEKPSNVNPYLSSLENQKPKSILKDSKGYYLAKQVRDNFAEKYGKRQSTILVDKLLTELPLKVTDLAQRTYLDEAIICFQHLAFRGSIVMCWNLCYDHLCHYILKNWLASFNSQLPKSCPKSRILAITTIDDFGEIKESEVLQVCKSASIISGDIYKIFNEKLNRRNMAAHPANVTITQLQAEDFITDLVNNALLKLI
jgi:hypothetical protein